MFICFQLAKNKPVITSHQSLVKSEAVSGVNLDPLVNSNTTYSILCFNTAKLIIVLFSY